MKLFAVYIGGEHERAHIELHDIRFILAETIEETYPELKRQWWGKPGTLHVDCWSELTQADGYKITLRRQPSETKHRLFYVNLGGYDPNYFTEMHKNMFVVAETESRAKVRALKTVRNWEAFHKDDMLDAEQAFCVDQAAQDLSWYIHLEKIDDESPAPFTCYYKRL